MISIGYRIIILWVLSGILAQFIKLAITVFKEKRVDFHRLIEPGGMPSSHSSASATLATSIGLAFGFDSPLFAITLFFGFVIMYEAAGLRRAAGKQAEILNKLVDTLLQAQPPTKDKLRELLGHTPIEVLLGVIMGILFAIAFF